MSDPSSLTILQNSIQERCDAISVNRDWPCRKGCDRCCRRLPAIPNFTFSEWRLVYGAYGRLAERVRREIRRRVALLPPVGPITCPFLDSDAALCRIYEARPVACRTYVFYRERGLGLFCREMQALDGQGEWDGVIWGNAATVEAKLDELGERKDMLEWFKFEGA